MSEMIERVARALAWQDLLLNADEDELSRAGVTKEGMTVDDCFVASARAAIEAMRRPLSQQLGEAAAAHGGDRVFLSSLLGDIISDALSEKP